FILFVNAFSVKFAEKTCKKRKTDVCGIIFAFIKVRKKMEHESTKNTKKARKDKICFFCSEH
ncbi:MAG: hypothetical protein BWK80_34030, partial [Desulfobacteraceae bacterium IS3]